MALALALACFEACLEPRIGVGGHIRLRKGQTVLQLALWVASWE